MNNVNSDGDTISNQNQKDGTQSIVSGTEVDEIKGKDSSLNMEKRTPKNERKQAERNGTHLLPDVGLTYNNVPQTYTPLSRIHEKNVSSSTNLDEQNVLSEQTEIGAVAENCRSESEPIVLHPDIQHHKEKGAIPKKGVGKSMFKTEITEMVNIIRKRPNKMRVDTEPDKYEIQSNLQRSHGSVDNMVDNINEEVDIFIRNKNKEDKKKVIKVVMKYISACLNTNGGIVKLNNRHFQKATGKDLDEWDKSGSLSELPAVEGDFEYEKMHSTLSENDQIQFKEISSKNVPGTFSSMINKYISAFSNHKGGRIFFGIEDKKFKVVGVELTEEDKKSITNLMYDKMENTMKWGCDNRTYVYGTHWSIKFLPVKNIDKPVSTVSL
ncbi:unnamed protein product [Mytilus coruscus]|uniref:Schlafen AlbA-2 domain-containing protein n=1 Tax=Mytilus coruscus TaxID=42192 RepID=A0A6J8EVC8_MYTCO|nr:unnamed protein product [Mytilus coruscus]